METVYLETTIIGHLTGRIVADPLVAARKHSTREWWDRRATRYQLFISQLVVDECSDGNEVAANSGFEPPIICTPDELMEFDDDTQSDN